MINHSKRKGDYKAFYTILKRKGLWRDPVYLHRKEALGCYIEDVRECPSVWWRMLGSDGLILTGCRIVVTAGHNYQLFITSIASLLRGGGELGTRQ